MISHSLRSGSELCAAARPIAQSSRSAVGIVAAAAILVVSAGLLAADEPEQSAPSATSASLVGAPGEADPPFPAPERLAGPDAAAVVDLQRQVNELRSGLLDERERRIGRLQAANGAVLVVLAIVIGGGGVWLCTRLRAIAAEARIGAAVARGYVPAPEGLLPGVATSLPPPGGRPGPLRLLGTPGPEADPDTAAGANGHARASSFAAPRPQATPRALASDGRPGPAGPAVPASDDDVERREEAIADCTEAIRLDPRNPRLYLERAGLRSELDRHEEAVEDYDRAISLDPDLAAAYLGRCHAKSELGLHEEAVEDYDRLVLLDPDSAAALVEG